jgi:CPA1 family monovalent cation:H+ antiporter
VRLLENAVFAVIGYQLAVFMRDLPSSQRTTAITMTAVIVGALLVVRAAALGIAAMLVARRPGRQPASYRPWQAAAVVTWAGTRGVVPLAAALAIPATVDSGGAFPQRALLLVVATAVVVVTLVVQGTTLRPLVTRLGVVDNER